LRAQGIEVGLEQDLEGPEVDAHSTEFSGGEVQAHTDNRLK
jgi:hypothetical protein